MIRVKNLQFAYNGKPVLTNISLGVDEGEFFGILGPNGSGKTTLLKCIDRTLDVSPKHVWIDNRDATELKRRAIARTIATVPQEVSYAFDFTAEEVVSMGRYPYLGRFEFESPAHKKIVKQAMKFTETWKFRNKPINNLSGGEKQRVIIAQAFAQEAQILLLDEPTKNLDIRHTFDILDLIKKKNTDLGLTVAAVFHDLNIAARYCDRVALLKDGEIFKMGPTWEVLNKRTIEKVFNVKVSIEGEGEPYIRILG